MFVAIKRVRFSTQPEPFESGDRITDEQFAEELPETRRRVRIIDQMIAARQIARVPDAPEVEDVTVSAMVGAIIGLEDEEFEQVLGAVAPAAEENPAPDEPGPEAAIAVCALDKEAESTLIAAGIMRVGGPWYQTPDGRKFKGKEAALAAIGG